VPVDKECTFDTDEGTKTLADLDPRLVGGLLNTVNHV
jgi:hypothetical protein